MRRRGFTLIELRRFAKGLTLIESLVVIAIIAILAGILFPVFARARGKAQQTHCLNNLKQLGTAMGLYAQDYENRLPQGVVDNDKYWYTLLESYVHNRQVFACPSDSTVGATTGLDGAVSYCYRDEYFEPDEIRSPPSTTGEWKKLYGYKLDQMEYPSDTAVLRDCKACSGATPNGAYTLTNQGGTFDSRGLAPSVPGNPNGIGPGFHTEGENFLYSDWHGGWKQHLDPSGPARLDWF